MQSTPTSAVTVASSVPGRIRLKLPPCDFSGRESAFEQTMRAIAGVTDLRWTRITSSLLVYYDRQRTSSAEILARCECALAPLAVPAPAAPAVVVRAVLDNGPAEGAAADRESSHGHEEGPAASPSARSLGPGKRLLGVFLVAVGIVLFIIPFVPGLPILLMGLTLLQLS